MRGAAGEVVRVWQGLRDFVILIDAVRGGDGGGNGDEGENADGGDRGGAEESLPGAAAARAANRDGDFTLTPRPPLPTGEGETAMRPRG